MYLLVDKAKENPDKLKCFVRLRRNHFHTDRKVQFSIELIYLKRKTEFNILQEDSDMAGADVVVEKIINLHECKDGVYQVVTCNEQADWETGYVDDYDYRLVPVECAGPENE